MPDLPETHHHYEALANIGRAKEQAERPSDGATGSALHPGSDDARQQGCKCPVMDNAHGRGYMGVAGVYVMNEACPLHGQRKKPTMIETDPKKIEAICRNQPRVTAERIRESILKQNAQSPSVGANEKAND